MNTRQKKKNFKKKYGFNPIYSRRKIKKYSEAVTNAISMAVGEIVKGFNQVINNIKSSINNIQNMSDEEFENKIHNSNLTVRQIEMALAIRKSRRKADE